MNAWIVVHPDNTVTISVAKTEIGQGSSTGLPMLVAEELECDWNKVSMKLATAHDNLERGNAYGSMATFGSRSTCSSQEVLRKASAAGREMLIEAAARNMKVASDECRAANSVITHEPSGRTVTFGEVAEAAAKMTPPENIKLKDPKEWKLIGTPQKRFDTADKVSGKPVYASDARPPGMVYAAILHSPVFGGKLKSYDADGLNRRKGIHKVVVLGDSAVAVIADTYWQAQKTLDSMSITWDDGVNGAVNSDTIARHVASGLNADDAGVGRENGDAKGVLTKAAKRIAAVDLADGARRTSRKRPSPLPKPWGGRCNLPGRGKKISVTISIVPFRRRRCLPGWMPTASLSRETRA